MPSACGVTQAGISTCGEEEVDDRDTVEHRGDHQRRSAIRSGRVHSGAALDQEPRDLDIALEGRPGERGLTAVVRLIRIGAVLDEEADGIGTAVVAREHQEAVALVIAQVGRQAHAEEVGESLGAPGPCVLEHALREGQRVVVEDFRLRLVRFAHEGFRVAGAAAQRPYRYAATSRASAREMPVAGMADFGSIPRGSTIQRIRLFGVFVTTPPT